VFLLVFIFASHKYSNRTPCFGLFEPWKVQAGQPITSLAFWWNVINFKNLSLPPVLESIRIPLAAIALGINSAYYNISFVDQEAQKLAQTTMAKNLWLGFETVLTIALIIGLQRWNAIRTPAQSPQG